MAVEKVGLYSVVELANWYITFDASVLQAFETITEM